MDPPPAAELANVYAGLGRLAKRRGLTEAGIGYLREALSWSRRSGAPAEHVLSIKISLAGANNNAGHLDTAEADARRLLGEIDEQGLHGTPLELDALNVLGTSLALQKRGYAEQADLHEKRFAITRAIYGAESGMYAYALADAVPTFRKAGQIARADDLGRNAVAITERVYDKPHMFGAVANCNLAALLMQEGNLAEAAEYLDRSIAIDEAIGRSDPHVESCRRNRAYVRFALSDSNGARADLAVDRLILERLGKQQSPLWLTTCGIEASILVREQNSVAASRLLDDCAADHSPTPPAPVDEFDLARAELDMFDSDWESAAARLADLRKRLPSSATSRTWLRPWMLSVHVARALGDTASRDRFIAAIKAVQPVPGMRDLAVAEPCLKPDPPLSACMALP